MNAVFLEDTAVDLMTTAEFQQLLSQTQLLRDLDLTLLLTPEEKLSFYGNLVNLMTLHVMYFCLERQAKPETSVSNCHL